MSDNPNPVTQSKPPLVTVESKRHWAPQIIWIIPILAIVVGLNLGYQAIVSQGPTITIAFKSGDGLEAGKTVIQYKGVNIGLVKKVALAKDNQQVIATVQLNKEAADFTKDDTRFWIVRPRITAGGVSGLSTLLSGPFISAEIGKASSSRKDFVALEVPPILTEGIPGREFTLKAPTLGSHEVGTQVYFRRLVVGEVVAYDLDKQGKDISIKVFINAPYDQYVTKNTRFWNASGIDLTVGATGVQLQTESLVAVVAGGIAFEAPPPPSDVGNTPTAGASIATATPSIELAEANSVFQLFQTRALAMKQPDSVTQSYVVNFKQSVKGLSVGAPVEFRGVNIGEVVSIGLSIDPKTFELVQPVEFSLYPQRLHARSSVTGEHIPFPKSRTEQLKRIKAFIDHGLRVQLRTSSLLTGQQYLAVDMFPDAPKYAFDISKSPLLMQSVPGAFDNIEQSIASAIKNTDALVKKLDSELIPELSQSLKNINAITASESPLQIDIRDSLREISKAASSVKTLTDMLEQQPQSLIFGKPSEGSKK
jgi:paraquat-inducible protein B